MATLLDLPISMQLVGNYSIWLPVTLLDGAACYSGFSATTALSCFFFVVALLDVALRLRFHADSSSWQ